MARGKKHTAEQIVSLLRQIEGAVANGKTTAQASEEALITEQTYYRWRKEYGALQVDQARRLKELEQENSKLKRLVAELSLDKLARASDIKGKLLHIWGRQDPQVPVEGRRQILARLDEVGANY